MPRRSGSAELPLHAGRVPAWVAQRMAALGRVISEAVVLHYGNQELLRRLSQPFWFQSFGAVMGMDWHSSGITTSVLGALKRGLAPIQDELDIYVCGGRGRHSRKTPAELRALGERVGLNAGECGPRDFADLLLAPNVGARTVAALALVGEVIHGALYRFSDPTRFSLAHGARTVILSRCR